MQRCNCINVWDQSAPQEMYEAGDSKMHSQHEVDQPAYTSSLALCLVTLGYNLFPRSRIELPFGNDDPPSQKQVRTPRTKQFHLRMYTDLPVQMMKASV